MGTMVAGALNFRTSSEAETENTGPLESDCVSPNQEDKSRKGLSEGEPQKLVRGGEKSTWVKLRVARNSQWRLQEKPSLC